ncbi:uncharacterized protein [Drosophila kikkawai]|uniref:Uncharacterized protein n=1 Tax=Drosophila kikkawai TaxID=30033 RepID=A0A6P4JRG7_DROKI|nr:uncharacterized protein LOC108085824 [Drosophila kikkawai]
MNSPKGSCERQSELARWRNLFWDEPPHKMAKMSQKKPIQGQQVVREKELQTESSRNADFERWKQLHQLRFLMYEEQRKYNLRCGSSGGASIWKILSMAQKELEDKLQLDKIRGNCQRFPSPMSLMVEQREHGGGEKSVLEPLRSFLCGCPETDSDEECDPRESSTNVISKAKGNRSNRKSYKLCAKESQIIGYCPLCGKRHLRLPPPF